MEQQEVNIQSNIRVALQTSSLMMDEVMVVAYGTVKKESFTGSAAVISNEKIEKRTVSNITKALDGQVAGVVTTSGGGQPGDGASIQIRGVGSINASSTPLYVVDGIPFDGSLSSLNPNDIEGMTVLKDASAGALYGARGANGVVLITTKKGKAGKTNINLKANWGWSSRAIKSYDMVDQKEFVQLTYESLRNGYIFNNNYTWTDAEARASSSLGTTLGGEIYNPFKNYTWGTIIDPATGQVRSDATAAWDENMLDHVMRNNALRQEYQFSMSGGDDKRQTFLSLGYINEDGTLQNTGFERFSGRISVDNQANYWLKGGLSAAFSHSKQNFSNYDGSSTANVWYTAQFMAPIYPVYEKNLDGTDALDEFGNKQLDYGKSRPKMGNFNSLGTLYDDKADTKNDNLSARSYLTFGTDDERAGVLRGLKFTINLGVDYRTQNQMIYYNMYHGNFVNQGGIISKYNTKTLSYTFNQLLTYNRQFGDHNIDALIGHENYDYEYNYLYASRSGLVDGIYELAPATTVNGASSYTNKYRIESYLARLNYNYKEKYYLSASWRTDGSSRFYKDNRWGQFWSIGGNWRISQEDFMQDISWIDNLALKASYGVQGNDDILNSARTSSEYYLWQSFYNMTYPNANQSGAVISSLENRKVTWEKNGNLNVGFDLRTLNNRLDFSIEYYMRKTSDLLLTYPMALSTGFEGYSANVGNMQNSGVEMSLSGLIINNRNFTWRTTLMGSTIKNKVTKLTDQTPEIINGVRSIKVGNPINTFYMAKAAGVDPATGAQLYWVYDTDDDGNMINERISSDYAKASTSKYYLGSRQPDFFGSISMDFTFLKDFDLSILSTYSIGGKIYDSLYRGTMEVMYTGDTWNKHVLRRWQKPGDITDVPRVEINGSYTVNDRFLIDASYFAIKNVVLGYTIPKPILKKAGIESLRFNFTMENPVLLSHLKGMDPQYSFTGSTDYVYSPNRTFSIGFDFNF